MVLWSVLFAFVFLFFFFKHRTAYEMRISDWSADVCSSDLFPAALRMLEDLARFGNAARNHEGQAAQRVDILLDLRQLFVDLLGDILQFGAGVGLPQRAEARRVGNACVSPGRSRCPPYLDNKQTTTAHHHYTEIV